MKGRGVLVVITLLFTVILLSAFVQCDHDGMARVTIHIQNEAYAGYQDSIIDKFFKLFSTEAVAWSSNHSEGFGLLTLTISGTGFETIQETLSPDLTTYTIDIPASTGITFKLIFYNGELSYNTFGAQTIVNLEPGDNDVYISMIPITAITDAYLSQDGIGIMWENINSFAAIVSGYNLYRSTSENGDYIKVNQLLIESPEFNDAAITPPTLTMDETYYYRVRAVTLDGKEGLLSDAVSRLYNP